VDYFLSFFRPEGELPEIKKEGLKVTVEGGS
jgi:hypothetical protein